MVHVKSIRSDDVPVLISGVSKKSVVNENIFALDVVYIIDEQMFTVALSFYFIACYVKYVDKRTYIYTLTTINNSVTM